MILFSCGHVPSLASRYYVSKESATSPCYSMKYSRTTLGILGGPSNPFLMLSEILLDSIGPISSLSSVIRSYISIRAKPIRLKLGTQHDS